MNIKPLFKHLIMAGALSLASNSYAQGSEIQVLSAVVKDKTIAGAEVILQKAGAESIKSTTDASGKATLNTNIADTNDTLMIIKKAGYSNLVVKCPCKGMTYALSPHMTQLDGLRVVLNWGASPSDLDSHMAYGRNHIFFERRNGEQAYLDVDDTDSYGPETITLNKKIIGENYVYAVHDFTNRTLPNSDKLSKSGAKVMVYIGQSLVRSYYVPKNTAGNLWTVFRITGDGEFQDINTLQGTGVDASAVLGKVESYLDNHTEVARVSLNADEIDRAKELNRQGELAYHAGNLEQATDLYRQAIDIDSNYGQAYSNLGLAYQKLGRAGEAIWANRKAVALAQGRNANTVRASSYYNIARIYETAGQYEDALNQYLLAKQQKANPVYDKAIVRMKKQLNEN